MVWVFLWDNSWKHSRSWRGTAGHEKLDETRNSRACGWIRCILFQKPLSAFHISCRIKTIKNYSTGNPKESYWNVSETAIGVPHLFTEKKK
jgi:hypothetical protein